jgi:hypothetical protein
VRTTIDISDDLLRAAKVRAAASDRTLAEVVNDALRLLLQGPVPADVPTLPVGRAARILPGVDLSPTGLRELLAAEDDAIWHERP